MKQPSRKRRKPRNYRRGNPLLGFLSVLIVVLAAAATLTLFFKVSHIEVSGNAVCDEQDIRAASGIEEGDFLLFINKIASRRNILMQHPYVDDAVLRQSLPNTVVIEITEAVPIVCIPYSIDPTLTYYWVADRKGKLLGYSQEEPTLPFVNGLTLLAPVEGTEIALQAEYEYKIQSLLDILEAVLQYDMLDDIQSFDLSAAADVKFTYLDRFVVNLGVTNDLDSKLEFLPHMVDELESNARGTIDLSMVSTRVARFIPA